MGSKRPHHRASHTGRIVALVTQKRVVLVETLTYAPGLLPFQAWDVIAVAPIVLLRDHHTHPSASALYFAGVDVETLEPAPLDRADLDLTRPGSPDDRRIAKALIARTYDNPTVVYLLGPDDSGVSTALAGMAAEHDVEIELVLFAQQPQGIDLLEAVAVVARLRDPNGGCPWDLAQDHDTLLRHLTEETFELVDAIESGDDAAIREELGDVLLQVLLHAQIASDRKAFGIDVVASELARKLVRRHPHVFADGTADTPSDVEQNWETLKAQEKASDAAFDGVPHAAPGLQLLTQLQSRAAKKGYERAKDMPTDDSVSAAIAALFDDTNHPEHQFARALDALIAQARMHGVDPDTAARAYARTFRETFEHAHQQLGVTATPSQQQWEQALRDVTQGADTADLTKDAHDE